MNCHPFLLVHRIANKKSAMAITIPAIAIQRKYPSVTTKIVAQRPIKKTIAPTRQMNAAHVKCSNSRKDTLKPP